MLELIRFLFNTNGHFYNFDEQCQYELDHEIKKETSSVARYPTF